MSIQARYYLKVSGSYLLILLLLIVLIVITLYLSDLRMKKIQQEIPKIGEAISTVPVWHNDVYDHSTQSQKHL